MTPARMVLILLLLAAAEAVAQQPQEKPAPVAAVFEIENRGAPLSADELRALGDLLASELGVRGMYRIIPREEVLKRLREQKMESRKECYDRTCQIEIGRELALTYEDTLETEANALKPDVDGILLHVGLNVIFGI